MNELVQLEARLEASLEQDLFRAVKKISHDISKVGLSLEESCLLARVDYPLFLKQMEVTPDLEVLITIKILEYKKDLLATLSRKAHSGDDKRAEWLLERMYPEEFYIQKKRGAAPPTDDLLLEAITLIQKSDDSKPLVESRKTIARITKGSGQAPIKPLADYLN